MFTGYGYCPVCGEPGRTRERRVDGNDMCNNGHIYKSSRSVDSPSKIQIVLDYETVEAIKQEIGLYHFAERHEPQMPIGRVKGCGCMGPLPECKCMKRGRLIREFLK